MNPASFKTFIQTIMRPYIVMLIGAPGTGKSTWINTTYEDFKTTLTKHPIIISTDNIIETLAKDMGKTYSDIWSTSNMKDIEKQMWSEFETAIAAERSIIVDRTNMSKKTRNKFLCKVPKYYARFSVVFTVDRDELNRRLETRNATGKVIREEIVTDILNRYEEPTTEEFEVIFK